mmetsp:Transcript_18564/g.16166  ORF Transcript_18564/g.16166 Transcript_18564/m.16166 type:complete len:307 (+) Transcript_18564:120-1040(+)
MISLDFNENTTKAGMPSDLLVTGMVSHSRFPIYQAYSKEQNKYFAIKFFPSDEESPSKNFTNEMKVQDLRHPNIVQVVHAEPKQKVLQEGETSMNSCLFMEFVPFPDFSTLAKDIEFGADPKLSRTYFGQIMSALQYLHSKGFAHMDIKPENMILTQDFKLKLIDFEFLMNEKETETLDMGTPHYRAPEVKERKIKCPKAADVYSAGITLFALHCGVMPYLEDTKFDEFDMEQLLHEDTKTFWAIHREIVPENVEITDNFKKLFEAMTNKDPSKRLSADEVMESDYMKEGLYSDEELEKLMHDFFF